MGISEYIGDISELSGELLVSWFILERCLLAPRNLRKIISRGRCDVRLPNRTTNRL